MKIPIIENLDLNEKNIFEKIFFYLKKNIKTVFFILFFGLIIVTFLSSRIQSSNYQIIYKNLSFSDSKVIIRKLINLNIPYKYSLNSGSLLIPEDKINEFQNHILNFKSKNDLPGFELLDKERFGISDFNEQINYQRALEGELSRTIEKLNFVQSARVHIAIPKTSFFFDEDNFSSASVFLNINTYNKKQDFDISNSIIELLSNSISNLPKKNISIINQFGELLSNPKNYSYQCIDDKNLNYINLIENKYQKKIESLLFPIFGKNNVLARVTAQIDFNINEKINESYCSNFNKQINDIFLNKNIENNNILNLHQNGNKKYVTSIVNFFPTKTFNLNKKNKINRFESINLNLDDKKLKNFNFKISNISKNFNEKDHENSRKIFSFGKIKTLSVSILINDKKNAKGEYVPLNSKELQNIKELVKGVIGFSLYKGDSINIVNYRFCNSESSLLKYSPIHKKESFNKMFILVPWFILFFFGILLFTSFYSFKRLTKKIQNSNFIFMKYAKKYFTNINLIENKLEEKYIKENKETIYKNKKFKEKVPDFFKNDPEISAMIIRKWINKNND
ncbi:MAG: flagellar M-ring protein FliF [Buchnera aphidicola (Periphyllus lyropictus)]|uniref:flagellar basal-body MS-ring/collar protein FliF n=1 Tax=Buchnera aphidicola TaxID=9 RepID=UPI001EC72C94|nr:flagellar basal-body MS-ring/collar protein FliF [Buchnera aphidicola]NIH16753.1 flagellar M-ring protein FliF [Buchnera aphidicola (Periphyllus lyropictus)]USS94654.1 flagellar M-ring protein FliF [Buchnera aphidicola (Periphyllus lyropictus)]